MNYVLNTEIYVLEKSLMNDLAIFEAGYNSDVYYEDSADTSKQESLLRKMLNKLKDLVDAVIGLFTKNNAEKRLKEYVKENPNAKFEMSMDPTAAVKLYENAFNEAEKLEKETDPEKAKTFGEKIKSKLENELDAIKDPNKKSKLVNGAALWTAWLGGIAIISKVQRKLKTYALLDRANTRGQKIAAFGLLIGINVTIMVGLRSLLTHTVNTAIPGLFSKKKES